MKNNNYKSILKYVALLLLLVGGSFKVLAQTTPPPGNPFITRWVLPPGEKLIEARVDGSVYYQWESLTYPSLTGSGNISSNFITINSATDLGTVRLKIWPINPNEKLRFFNPQPSSAEADSKLRYLKAVEQWGDVQWSSTVNMFANAPILNEFPASPAQPNLSSVTNMQGMFYRADIFNEPIGHWDVSNVTNMSLMFNETDNFNQPLNDWDVSKVTDMSWMFSNALSFNQPLSNWEVGNVTNMSQMFMSAQVFNQDISTWDVDNVTSMYNMFNSAREFNQPLNSWNVANVTTMENMFSGARNFNQPLNNWDVSKVTNMIDIFKNANAFNQELGNWKFNAGVTFNNNSFIGTAISCENYSLSLYGWSQNNTATNIGINIPKWYSTNSAIVAARDYLTTTLGWNITDNGPSAACLVSLPIHLGSFEAIAHQSQVNLEWSTFAEMNNKGFEIQRSEDGRNWEKMTWMNSQAENGNSSELLSYYFTDHTPLKGSNYYRLKQVDVDGKVTYSEIRVVNMGSNNTTNYVVYPNPVQHELNISNLIGTEKVEIYNAMGALVLSQQATSKISLNTLPTGMYLVKIIDAKGQVHQEKIIKQ